jgi:hypothetical protein
MYSDDQQPRSAERPASHHPPYVWVELTRFRGRVRLGGIGALVVIFS